MTLSLVLSALLLALLPLVDGPLGAGVLLVLVGAAGAPLNAASGRLVMGRFAPAERGLAMGVRQGATPLGLALAAALLPLAAERWGFGGAMLLPALLSLAMAPVVALFLGTPHRSAASTQPSGRAAPEASSPYRRWTIWRVHAVSMLLGIPQFTVLTYALVYLVSEHGWTAPGAGAAIALTQLPGALLRLVVGAWSDRTGSRLGPVRVIAVGCAAGLVLLWLSGSLLPAAAVPLLFACLLLSMIHNGLTFTAAAETAGMAWAGRAMAAQNALQALSTTLTPVLMAGVITLFGLTPVFAVAALFCVAAVLAAPPSAAASAAPRITSGRS